MAIRKIIWGALLSAMALVFGSCFLLKKYIYTDQELLEHFKNKKLKPVYNQIDFLISSVHYAKISRSDTLPLLLLIHGAPGAWYGYLNLMDDSLLQEHFKMVSVDRLGYGKSNYGQPEVSVQLQALEIKRIIEEENYHNKKVFLIGRSYGAPIAAWYAIHYPQNVEKLFMISPVIDPAKEKFYWFSDIGKWGIVQVMLPKMLNVATSEKYAHGQEMQKMLPLWKNLYSTAYVITGEDDHLADTANFSFAKKELIYCDCKFMKLKNTGHQVTRQHPELIKKLLLETIE
jgi:pimeloyl-ACP methyl ester carboxylesterase